MEEITQKIMEEKKKNYLMKTEEQNFRTREIRIEMSLRT